MGEYSTVVIDFPWKKKSENNMNGISYGYDTIPYPQMSNTEIMEFDIERFMADDCLVILWGINSKLEFLFEYLHAHGLKFRALGTWVKDGGPVIEGINYKAEYYMIAYRGKWIKSRKPTIPTILYAPRTEHSEKPTKFYQMLIQCDTPEPRIDVFARRRHFKFSAWGDQVVDEPHEQGVLV